MAFDSKTRTEKINLLNRIKQGVGSYQDLIPEQDIFQWWCENNDDEYVNISTKEVLTREGYLKRKSAAGRRNTLFAVSTPDGGFHPELSSPEVLRIDEELEKEF